MTITAPETTQERFSARLKESTKHVHDNAEHSTFMEDLMGGSLNTEAYLRLINQYVHIYEALEAVSEHYRAEPNPSPTPSPTPASTAQNTSVQTSAHSARKATSTRPCPQPQNT